jgi:N-acetylglucosaminyl-diphospho-decaprenol L-rhamnosyltransferase
LADAFRPGVVIPTVEGRDKNLELVLTALDNQSVKPKQVVVVCDGWEPENNYPAPNLIYIPIEKYQPSQGMDQPRNVGAKALDGCNYVWFLDQDCLPAENCLENYRAAWKKHPDIYRILIGPYEWMAPEVRQTQPGLKNDPRWEMFNDHDPDIVKVNDLGFALGNFSGNLVWPLEQFKQIGGYWNEIHAGRVEDGELGLRAASLGVPMSVVRDARAYHMWHEENRPAKEEKNQRDLLLLWDRHGRVEETGLKIVNEDGKRLNYVCEDCGEEFNTLLYWEHKCLKST